MGDDLSFQLLFDRSSYRGVGYAIALVKISLIAIESLSFLLFLFSFLILIYLINYRHIIIGSLSIDLERVIVAPLVEFENGDVCLDVILYVFQQFLFIRCAEAVRMPSIISTSGTTCLLYTSPSPRDRTRSRMPSSA